MVQVWKNTTSFYIKVLHCFKVPGDDKNGMAFYKINYVDIQLNQLWK